jgi:polar amino acid transport system substrate-binding protein
MVTARGTLNVGIAEAAPDQYKDPKTGEWKGAYVDFLRFLAQQMSVKIAYFNADWNTYVSAIQAGQFDIGSDINIRPARAAVVSFSQPIDEGRLVFQFNPDRTPVHSSAELTGNSNYSLAVVQGTAQDKLITLAAPKAKIVRFPDQNTARLALVSGRVNAFMDAAPAGGAFCQANPGYKLLVTDPAGPLGGVEGIGFAINHGYSYDDIQFINSAIDAFKGQGLWAASLKANGYVDPTRYIVGS